MSERHERRRKPDQLEDDLQTHRVDTFAHQPMVNRIMQENVGLRDAYDRRLNALEQFKAQAVVLGGIGLLVLGATTGAVAFKLLGL